MLILTNKKKNDRALFLNIDFNFFIETQNIFLLFLKIRPNILSSNALGFFKEVQDLF